MSFDLRRNWIEVLGRELDEDQARNLVIQVSGAPTISMGTSPRSEEDVEQLLADIEEMYDRIIAPELPETKVDEIRKQLVQSFRDELRDKTPHTVEVNEVSTTEHSVPKVERLREGSVLTKHRTAHAIANEALADGEGAIDSEVIRPIAENLTADDHMVRQSSARALTDISMAHPEHLEPVLDELLMRLQNGSYLVQEELLSCFQQVIQALPPEDHQSTIKDLVAVAEDELYHEKREIRENAAELLKILGNQDPKYLDPAVTGLLERYNDPSPAVAKHIRESLKTIQQAETGTLEVHLGSGTLPVSKDYGAEREAPNQTDTTSTDSESDSTMPMSYAIELDPEPKS